MMKKPLSTLVAAVSLSLLAPSLTLTAATETTCAASATCASATAATASTASACCASEAKGDYVLLKLKGGKRASLTQALAQVQGVGATETCGESKFTRISFDKEKACSTEIMAALKKSGYRVQAQRITYAVEGLACGSCATQVSKALSKVKGVSDAKVCSESKQAVVDFDPNKVSAEKILATLDATGFKASAMVN
ncbi:MAG: heavy-metal-associated domain-containing protein [Limisphaerales bacterium]